MRALTSIARMLAAACFVCAAQGAESADARVVRARDFGAIPDDGKDDAAALRKAVAAAAKAPAGTRLVLEKGVYDLVDLEKGDRAVPLSNLADFTVEGNGATLMTYGRTVVFPAYNCSGLTFEGLNFDCKKFPYAVAKVVASRPGSFDCAVEAPYAVEDGARAKGVIAFDPEHNRMGSGLDVYQLETEHLVERLSQNTMRVRLDRANLEVPVGMPIIVRYEVYGPSAINFLKCKDVVVRDVRIIAHPGMGVTGHDTENILIDRLDVRPKDGHAMSSTADATHFNYCRGTIDIRDSRFENMGDDATNVHQAYWIVAGKPDERTLRVKFGWDGARHLPPSHLPRAGDAMQFGAADNWLRPERTATVRSTSVDGENKTADIVFEDALPDGVAIGMPISNATAQTVLSIENCQVRNNRARGFLIKTATASVKNCEFDSTTLPGILLENDNNYWFEGNAVTNLTVENCVFKNCDFWRKDRSAIADPAAFAKGTPSKGPINGRVAVKNCVFENCGEEPVKLRRTADVELSGNTVR